MVESQRDQYVVDACHRRGALDEQLVRPSHAGIARRPGTAITVTPRSDAALAVIRLPPRWRDLDDDEHLGEAAMMRFRSGKWKSSGGVPGGHSDTSSPLSATHRQMSPFCFGYGRSRPLPTTPTSEPSGRPTPRWAAPSMPRARPETTATRLPPNASPNSYAVARSGWVAGECRRSRPGRSQHVEAPAHVQHGRREQVVDEHRRIAAPTWRHDLDPYAAHSSSTRRGRRPWPVRAVPRTFRASPGARRRARTPHRAAGDRARPPHRDAGG